MGLLRKHFINRTVSGNIHDLEFALICVQNCLVIREVSLSL